jgi:hypothetical protein
MIALGAPSGPGALSAGVDAGGNPVPPYFDSMNNPAGTPLALQTGASTCPGGCDPALRPVAPALFCTDITDANNNKGDWQIIGGTGTPPDFVSGTWKSATSSVNGSGVPTTTVDGDPTRNVTSTNSPVTWFAGPNADAPSPGGYDALSGNLQKYGTEVRWNVNSSTIKCTDAVTGVVTTGLTPGHLYRVQFLIHDGDQNNTGGDAGQSCAIIAR